MPRLASPVFAVWALSACAGSTDTTSRKPDGGSSTLVTDVGLYATTEPGWNQELYWAVADLNGDGCTDVVTGDNRVGYFRGDCAGGVSATTYADNGPAWVVGVSACVADLNGDGHVDLLLLDAHTSETIPLQDIVAYEMDWSATPPIPTAIHRLPVPVWDRDNTGAMRSHDQRCAIG